MENRLKHMSFVGIIFFNRFKEGAQLFTPMQSLIQTVHAIYSHIQLLSLSVHIRTVFAHIHIKSTVCLTAAYIHCKFRNSEAKF